MTRHRSAHVLVEISNVEIIEDLLSSMILES